MTDAPPAGTTAPGLRWIAAVVGLLVFSVGAQLIFLAFATGDPSSVAEPDYYRKAVEWDAERAQRRQNAELGWSLELELTASQARVHLCDAAGAPLDGARIRLSAFHKARAAHVLTATLSPQRDGSYLAPAPFERAGIWELRFLVDRSGETFTHTIERELFTKAKG